jgi:hypothetical protein
MVSAFQVRSVASNSAVNRLDAVSSGPMTRNVRGLARTTSRRYSPAACVAELDPAPGWETSTA